MTPDISIETRMPVHFLTQSGVALRLPPEVALRLPTGGGASLTTG
jgi:hypothetical protein